MRLALDDDIARDFAARTEGLLRFAIELGLDAPGVTERQDKLVLAFPSGLFSRSEQGLLWTAAIDLNDDPTQLCRLKVECQLSFRCRRPFERNPSQRPIAPQRRYRSWQIRRGEAVGAEPVTGPALFSSPTLADTTGGSLGLVLGSRRRRNRLSLLAWRRVLRF